MLLYRNRYDKRIKPSGLTVVNVSVTLLSLSSPDESSLKYEVEFLMHQHWKDGRLKFKSDDDHLYLNAIDHQNDIWLPDTYFIKHGDFKDPLITANIELRVYADGFVRFTMRRHLILKCTGNLDIFPFDDPCCKFNIESTSHEKKYLVYNWTKPDLKEAEDIHSLNAYMIGKLTLNCDKKSWRGNFSCLGVELNFTRDKSFYFSTVFIPGMLLVTSSFITFWLEWNAVPGRVMLGVTTMLNFFTMSNNFRSNLPVVSNLTAMNVWDGVCMCFIYASLLEFVTVNYLARKKPRKLAAAAATATATATATALTT
uniref:Neurotransmitter-gated ion-channel ligand-binding domain-containing protein n=1 Tax=Strigamia maritima TaxID=126957 RepID=T1J0D0_STRMM